MDSLERGQLRWWAGDDWEGGRTGGPVLIVGKVEVLGYEDEWLLQHWDGRVMHFTERIILGHSEVVDGVQ